MAREAFGSEPWPAVLSWKGQSPKHGQAGGDGQFDLSEIHGGSPWGASTLAGADGSRQPSALELRSLMGLSCLGLRADASYPWTTSGLPKSRGRSSDRW